MARCPRINGMIEGGMVLRVISHTGKILAVRHSDELYLRRSLAFDINVALLLLHQGLRGVRRCH